MPNFTGVEDLSMEELDALFNIDDGTQSPPTATETNVPGASPDSNDDSNDDGTNNDTNKDTKNEETKAFSKRLNESIAKEREKIAKSMGFESYEDMMKKRETKIIEEKGLDPEQVTPVVDELVKQRINSDPRMKELETLRRKQVEEFGKRELAEISKLTDGEITSFNQLPKAVIELWKTKGSLKAAYLELEGERLITKMRSAQSKGSTNHMNTPKGNSTHGDTKRPLTAKEKEIWKLFNPNISMEELNKKTIDR